MQLTASKKRYSRWLILGPVHQRVNAPLIGRALRYFVITPQAMRSPELPEGSVLESSALAWMPMDVPPLLSSESSAASLSSNRNGPALPLASTVKFFMSPAWWPSGLSNPCFLPSGLKCPPADLKSGPSHFGAWWKCMACSPGGKSCTVSSSPTVCGPLAQRITPPTTLPCASLSSTCVLATLSAEKRVRKRDKPQQNETSRFIGPASCLE